MTRRPARPVPCTTVRAAVSAALDGEATGLAPGAVEAHCAVCPDCRRLRTAMAGVAAWRHLRPAPEPPEGLVAWLTRLQPAPARRPAASSRWRSGSRRPGAWAAALPTVFAAVALPLGLGTPSRPPPSHAPASCPVRLHQPQTRGTARDR